MYASKRFALLSSASFADADTTLVDTLVAALDMILTISSVFSTTGNVFAENRRPAPIGNGVSVFFTGCGPHTLIYPSA